MRRNSAAPSALGIFGSLWPLVPTLVALALLAFTLASCGSSGPSARTSTVTPLTGSGASAFARAVNLRAGDEPAMSALGQEKAVAVGSKEAGYTRCTGGPSAAQVLLNVRSTILSSGRTGTGSFRGVVSRVTVLPSEAIAQQKLAASASARGSSCALRYGGRSVSKIVLELPGGVRAIGHRIVGSPGAGRDHPVAYHDLIGFVVGPAEVAITTVNYSRPPTAGFERRLLEILYGRARKARGLL